MVQKAVEDLFILACITVHGSKRMLFIITQSDTLHFIKLMLYRFYLRMLLNHVTRTRLGGPLLP